eukprot:5435017-Pyramimonas_sp.AAC.1
MARPRVLDDELSASVQAGPHHSTRELGAGETGGRRGRVRHLATSPSSDPARAGAPQGDSPDRAAQDPLRS